MSAPAPSGRAVRTLADAAGWPNGFDTIRLLAAVAVLVSHAFALTGQAEPGAGLPGRITLGGLAVAVFFVISGYLVSISRDRSSLAGFAVKRARRIYPGLVVHVGLCLLVLGPVMTELPLRDYLAHPETRAFAANALALGKHFALPGVFAGRHDPAINGSLWTIRLEVTCYLFVAAALAAGRMRALVVIAAWLVSFPLARIVPEGSGGAGSFVFYLAGLFRFFGAGMVLHLFAGRVPVNRRSGWAAAGLLAASALTPAFAEVAATAGSYALMVFAVRAPGWFRDVTRRGDISYGVYLYAWPIQQLCVPLALKAALPWLVVIALALPLTLAAGALSWVLVERPMLRVISSRMKSSGDSGITANKESRR